jgi:hypothetical protein
MHRNSRRVQQSSHAVCAPLWEVPFIRLSGAVHRCFENIARILYRNRNLWRLIMHFYEPEFRLNLNITILYSFTWILADCWESIHSGRVGNFRDCQNLPNLISLDATNVIIKSGEAYKLLFFQWLFQPIQDPGLLFSSMIIFHRR